MKAKNPLAAVRRTFVDPFRDLKRNLLYLGTFLGVYGFALMNTISSYDLGTAGLVAIMSYFGPSLLLAAFVYWPLLYLGFSAVDGVKWRLFVFMLQGLSIIAFINAPQEPLIQGLVFGVSMSPFWTAHHIAMTQNTTKGNRGYEVSIGHFIFMTGGVFSALTSAYFLQMVSPQTGQMIALATLLTGTTCLFAASKIIRQHTAKHFISECRRVAKDNPYMARRIVSQSLFDMSTYTIAGLMHIMGISPTILAVIIVARLAIMFVLSPVIGTMAHKHRKHGYGIGLALAGCGWFILSLAPDQGIAFFLCLMLFVIGMSFASSSLMTGLYEKQSYATMMWSEVFLGIGRASGMIFLIPIMYYDVKIYLYILTALSFAIFAFNRRWLKTYATEVAEEGQTV